MGTRFKGDTKDPVVNITTWCLLVVMILSVLSRLGTKIRLFRQLIVDDFLIITSLVFGVGQSVAVSLAVGSGYGKHLEDLTKDEMDHMMKVIGGTEIYAASLLCTLSLLFSKLSLVIFIRRLTPTCEKRRVGRGVEAMIYAWATVTFFGSAFSCAIPRTFDLWHGHCFNLLAWRYFIGISNIGTELLIIVQATIVMLIIQSWGLRMIFASIFVPRTLVVSAIIAQLAFTRNGVRSADGPYDMCELTIFDAIVQCLSVMTACWPQIKPFLSWVRSNGLKIREVENRVTLDSKTSPQSQTRPTFSSLRFDAQDPVPLTRQNQILITTSWDVESQSSNGGTAPASDRYGWAGESGSGGGSGRPRCSIN